MKTVPNASVGFVSTFPPTVCGIATYTASIVDVLTDRRSVKREVGVVSLTDRNVGVAGEPVVFHHRGGDADSLRAAIKVLNSYDTISIQHEYGIFAGEDGAEVIELMSRLTRPIALTLHTVLKDPTSHQRAITEQICALAERIVVLSQTASTRLTDLYGVDPARITMIPHGADAAFAGPSRSHGDRPLILTWGLIGPGKGLEWAIEACQGLEDMDPLPRYVITGSTHPHVRQHSGESYRHSLMSLVDSLSLTDVVEFDNRYLNRKALARLVRSSDIVVLPYESVEQVTSGVLVEAIAATRPVVATPFPHAVELLSNGAGALVPYGDPKALGSTLRALLADRSVTDGMSQRARELADGWLWPNVGRRFGRMMSEMAHTKTLQAAPTPRGRLVAG